MSLKGFFREAAIQPEHIKTVISRRFLDEEGNAIAWELRPVPEPENAKIRESCISKKLFKGRMVSDFNSSLYTLRLCAAAVVFPDLADAELQKDYGVIGAEALLQAMLVLPAEMTALQQQVQLVCGYELEQFDEDREEVKNS